MAAHGPGDGGLNVLPAIPAEALRFLAFLTLELAGIYLAVVLLVEALQARLGPDRMERLLGRETTLASLTAAAILGSVTPFCSCSTVPLVAGMERAGVAWPVLGTFLVVSPLLNPALFALVWTFLGVRYAALYVAASLLVAVFVGAVIHLAGWTPREDPDAAPAAPAGPADEGSPLRAAAREALRSTARMSPVFVAAGVLGATLRYGVGTAWIEGLLAGTGWWGVPAAAVIGIPVYASTAVLLPLGALLLQQGVDLGIVTAFLMGATGFSVPEGVMLKELIGARRLGVLAGAFSVAVVAVGYAVQLLGW
jgi:uncharacterized membrane protein YraQ (UPF0718 family)